MLVAEETDTIAAPVAPTPKEIDALCAEYERADQDADAAAAVLKEKAAIVGELKQRLIAMTEAFGGRHTEKSKRLPGLHSFAQTTRGTRTETIAAAVEAFKVYLESAHMPGLVERFFRAHTTYSLVSGPDEVLRQLDLPARVRTKMTAVLKACFEIRTTGPSLKVEIVKVEKPAKV